MTRPTRTILILSVTLVALILSYYVITYFTKSAAPTPNPSPTPPPYLFDSTNPPPSQLETITSPTPTPEPTPTTISGRVTCPPPADPNDKCFLILVTDSGKSYRLAGPREIMAPLSELEGEPAIAAHGTILVGNGSDPYFQLDSYQPL